MAKNRRPQRNEALRLRNSRCKRCLAGCVLFTEVRHPGPEADRLGEEIRDKLRAFRDPDTGAPVLEDVYLGGEIFHGARMADAPDLQLDFQIGYRTSWQTSLGAIPPGIVVANMKKWSGDHCASDPKDAGGIFFSNRRALTENPSIVDIAPTVLNLLDVPPPGPLDGKALNFAR